MDYNGRVTNKLLGYTSLDCTARAWYKAAQKNMIPGWTPPFLLLNNFPAIAYAVPLINMSYAGRTTGFVGSISLFVQLSQISNYLEGAYANSSNAVFIVDKSSGYLIGSSLGAKTYSVSTAGVNVLHRLYNNFFMHLNSNFLVPSFQIFSGYDGGC